MQSLPMKTFKNELHNLLLWVLEQSDDYLDTDQITFALKKSDHMNAGYEHAHTLHSIAGFGKNEQNLMEKKNYQK